MRSIKKLQDVVDWGLCIGCGACYAFCEKNGLKLRDIPALGIRPEFNNEICRECVECLSFCPGYSVNALQKHDRNHDQAEENLLIGPTLEVWEGYAGDPEIRFGGSSGGILTALALYCLEKENMAFVLHTGMDTERPWANVTVKSRNRNDLMQHTGSRYVTSSPCDGLREIENSEKPCVFIGKPCDAAAVNALRQKRPRLDANLGLVLTFCCAGTPGSQAGIDLLKKLNVDPKEIVNLKFRGDGWPGEFTTSNSESITKRHLSYIESWDFLQAYRPFRCKLCPDGLGELGDISCGDAWHRYNENNENSGLSLVMVRSSRGRQILHKAMEGGYVKLKPSSPAEVVKAQGLVERRMEIFGRQTGMKILLIPTTRFIGFNLFRSWLKASAKIKIKSIFGTMRRLIQRGLWHKNPLKY